MGLKALAVYRDNCKVGQPLSDAKADKGGRAAAGGRVRRSWSTTRSASGCRRRRPSQTISFSVGGAEGYLTAGSYPDDGLGELFLKFGKQGSTLGGIMDAFSIAVSIGLQYGVPLETFVEKFTNLRFEPAGSTDDPDIRMAQSIMDYVFRRLALDYLRLRDPLLPGDPHGRRAGPPPGDRLVCRAARTTSQEDIDQQVESSSQSGSASRRSPNRPRSSPAPERPPPVRWPRRALLPGPARRFQGKAADAPICLTCGTKMRPAGSCYVCEGCGTHQRLQLGRPANGPHVPVGGHHGPVFDDGRGATPAAARTLPTTADKFDVGFGGEDVQGIP